MRHIIQKHGHFVTFGLAFFMSALTFLPFIIINDGFFFYYGDFNLQQIPFYQHAHEMIRSGNFGWDPITDLGANLVGSYSFYCLFSPFFWLTIPFPNWVLPYLMAPLLMLKTACAALTSYFYIKRFVADNFYAVLGGILYAFSGFMAYNIFFNHFHEVIVFFPLMLISLEELLCNNRRGLFAFAVALNAVVNYWFFIGEVVFVIIYFLVRTTSPTCKISLKRFLHTLFEGLLGVGLAAVIFMPSVMTILGNPRTGFDDLIFGWNMWYYHHPQRYLAILHSLFFPPDMPSLPNFFTDHGAKWSSLAAYLPMLGLSGVLVFVRRHRRHWLRHLLLVCGIMALVPVLNSTFVLFNGSYYTRWLYMPILLMCAATVVSLEQRPPRSWSWSLGVSMAVVALITAIVGLTPSTSNGNFQLGLAGTPGKMWLSVFLALLGLSLASLIILQLHKHPRYKLILASALCSVSVVYTISCMGSGVYTFHDNDWIADEAIAGRGNIELPDDGNFARVDFHDSEQNMGLYWELPSIQTFHSIVPVSIMEFYPEVGVTRDVSSNPQTEYPALRPFLSVKWLFVADSAEDQSPMEGYTYYSSQYGHNIYENDNYIPMGFAYDGYISQSTWDNLSHNYRTYALLKGVLLEEEVLAVNTDLLDEVWEGEFSDTSPEAFAGDVATLQGMASTSGVFVDGGYTFTTNYDDTEFMFFSIPYEEGWSASIDGRPAEILKANIGFMAVRVPSGERTIRFDYQTPGMENGAIISVLSLAIIVGFIVLGRIKKPEPLTIDNPAPPPPQDTPTQNTPPDERSSQDE